MRGQRVLAIGLDGLEIALAERLMAAGDMPALAELRDGAACFLLDHGPAQRTGLAWEHVASGRSPDAARRWAAVEFDPSTYKVWQEGARFEPWWTTLERSVVIFDTPYVDLRRASGTRGVVGWGAHDPGVRPAARPLRLLPEFLKSFGEYPSRWTYATPWPSAERSREMGAVLSEALETRTRAAQWLATERLPDWDLFFAVAGELHGAIEGLWHGVDRNHPLHGHPSAPQAGNALVAVHRALDRMIGVLVRSAGRDAAVVAFTMGGMGPNHSDAQSMALLPELLYRYAFDAPLLTLPPAWTTSGAQLPMLGEDESWRVADCVPGAFPPRGRLSERTASFVQRHRWLRAGVKATQAALREWRAAAAPTGRLGLEWQPASRYAAHWPRMPAFALPSFYDGRIRINLKGRERDGIVEASRYENVCRNIETLLGGCRNPLSGEPAVESIERATGDPLRLGSSESDVLVIWRGVATALEHPRLGLIGPVPLRRTGGHTGRHGVAYVRARGIRPGDHGVRSAFDVAPTIIELLGCEPDQAVSGATLLTGSGMLSRTSW